MSERTTALGAVSVPATTANLGPGFDAFGAALSLRMQVRAVAPDPARPLVTTTGEGVGNVATDAENLVWRSLVAACERFGWDVPAVALQVHTPIPLARGLGSSSAAIVGGIALARLLAGADGAHPATLAAPDAAVGDVALTRLADELEGHPDNVAPAVHGGVVAAAYTDDGDLVVRTAPPSATTRPVLLVPAVESLTSEARAVLPDALPRTDVAAQAARAGHVVGGLLDAWPVDPRLAGDRLHEPPRLAALPAGSALLEQLRGAGHHAWLSGAGPSLAVALPLRDEAALTAVTALAERYDHRVLVLTWDRQGVRSCAPGSCGVAGGTSCQGCPLSGLQ